MRVFVTGASGWIGSAAVGELLSAGHEVVGLARSDASAAALEARGVQVRRGDLDDLDGIRAGARDAEAVLHLANKHDWSDRAASDAAERAAVQAIAETLDGTGKRFLLASGVAGLAQPGRPASESVPSPFHGPGSPRGGAENLALEHVGTGVHVVGLRFAPSVHGVGDHGFVSSLVAVARDKGLSGYVGDGSHGWSAVHRSDAARLVALGLEKASAGALLHAVGEEAVPTREIAEAIGRVLDVPVVSLDPADAVAHFGWIGAFFGADFSATSTVTRATLGWTPTGPTLVEDILAGAYTRG